jgi:DNA-binding transcriptional ArsR family regulator
VRQSGGLGVKLPTIASSRTQRAAQAEQAFSAAYFDYQYCFVDFFVDHLSDLGRVFKGDLQQMMVLAVVGQAKIRAVRAAVEAGMDPAQAARVQAGLSASRVADIIGVPRQTVRRKLALLRDQGWVLQHADDTWGIAGGEGPGSVRASLAEVDLRAIGRIARLFADLERIVDPRD